ncbi:unnamed protein product, partial [Mesorhabditis spiculigera]
MSNEKRCLLAPDDKTLLHISDWHGVTLGTAFTPASSQVEAIIDGQTRSRLGPNPRAVVLEGLVTGFEQKRFQDLNCAVAWLVVPPEAPSSTVTSISFSSGDEDTDGDWKERARRLWAESKQEGRDEDAQEACFEKLVAIGHEHGKWEEEWAGLQAQGNTEMIALFSVRPGPTCAMNDLIRFFKDNCPGYVESGPSKMIRRDGTLAHIFMKATSYEALLEAEAVLSNADIKAEKNFIFTI